MILLCLPHKKPLKAKTKWSSKICGTCADARGIKNLPLIEGAQISTMAELTTWMVDSDKVITF